MTRNCNERLKLKIRQFMEVHPEYGPDEVVANIVFMASRPGGYSSPYKNKPSPHRLTRLVNMEFGSKAKVPK